MSSSALARLASRLRRSRRREAAASRPTRRQRVSSCLDRSLIAVARRLRFPELSVAVIGGRRDGATRWRNRAADLGRPNSDALFARAHDGRTSGHPTYPRERSAASHDLAVACDPVDPVGDDAVAPWATADEVELPVGGLDHVCSTAALDGVLASAARDGIGAVAAEETVVAGPAMQRVVTAETEEYVDAGPAAQDVGGGGAAPRRSVRRSARRRRGRGLWHGCGSGSRTVPGRRRRRCGRRRGCGCRRRRGCRRSGGGDRPGAAGRRRVGVAGRIGGADGEVVCAGGEATELERRAAPREGSRIETAGEARARLAGEEGEAGARVGRRLARAGVDCCLGCGCVDDADRPRAAGGRRVGVACRVDRAYLEAVRAGDEAAVLPWGRAGREGNSVEPPPCAQLGLSAGCGSRPRPTRRAAERRHG